VDSCRVEDSVDFSGAIFTGDAGFNEATFTGTASFERATFTGTAWFEKATFTGDALFREATFTGGAGFRKATFTGAAVFDEATFTSAASFVNATFTRTAWFIKATFTGAARFGGATFTGAALFDEATFTGAALFIEAAFTGAARFNGALAHALNFSRTLFSAPDPGPWIASSISLHRTTLAVRSRISITATEIDASWFHAREGAHLVLHHARVDLSDSEFLRRSIVSSPAAPEKFPLRAAPAKTKSNGDSAREPQERARAAAAVAVESFRSDLISQFATLPPRCRLTSLARANIGELVLSDVILDDCAFAGAHGLDKLRIGAGCSFQQTRPASSAAQDERTPGPPRWWGRRRMVRRRVIAEELQWRAAHTRSRDEPKNPEPKNPEFLPAVEIAGIYRDLRKGLEDAKNEPGAADFYYGEMEMRRLAGRKPTEPGRKPTDAASKSPAPSWAERILLYGYWAVSGYGLRASRALLTLIAVVAGAAMLYTMPAFATVTPPTPPPAQILMIDPTSGAVTYTPPPERTAPGFGTALEYSARESISLLQVRGMPAIDTTGVGTLLDFLLRLAGPVLLAFAVLALRARTKR
jgi:uncharacterized protein YjbI with pentapeptide repeats